MREEDREGITLPLVIKLRSRGQKGWKRKSHCPSPSATTGPGPRPGTVDGAPVPLCSRNHLFLCCWCCGSRCRLLLGEPTLRSLSNCHPLQEPTALPSPRDEHQVSEPIRDFAEVWLGVCAGDIFITSLVSPVCSVITVPDTLPFLPRFPYANAFFSPARGC